MKQQRHIVTYYLLFLCLGACLCNHVPLVSTTFAGEPVQVSATGFGVIGHPKVAHLFPACVDATGSEYIRLREELLSLGNERLRATLAPELLANRGWSERLVAKVVLRWNATTAECERYHETFEAWIRSSYGTVTGEPSDRSISGFCLRDSKKGNDHEVLMLERLLKYDDPPHVKRGIARALGVIGTRTSLNPLLALMKSTEDEALCRESVMGAAKICMRFPCASVVKELVHVYRTRPRVQPTLLPGMDDCDVPPRLQATVVSGLSHIGGNNVLEALQELRASEVDPALITALENAQARVRARLEQDKEN